MKARGILHLHAAGGNISKRFLNEFGMRNICHNFPVKNESDKYYILQFESVLKLNE